MCMCLRVCDIQKKEKNYSLALYFALSASLLILKFNNSWANAELQITSRKNLINWPSSQAVKFGLICQPFPQNSSTSIRAKLFELTSPNTITHSARQLSLQCQISTNHHWPVGFPNSRLTVVSTHFQKFCRISRMS